MTVERRDLASDDPSETCRYRAFSEMRVIAQDQFISGGSADVQRDLMS
jgi:hypothetical protein